MILKSSEIQSIINRYYEKYRDLSIGSLANYIPELSKANPSDFAIAAVTAEGAIYTAGDCDLKFTLQSTSKPFVYGLALLEIGQEKMLSKVGVEPTGEAFNSIIELEKVTHRPYNPMINSGAIAVSSLISGKSTEERMTKILSHFEKLCGHQLEIDENVFESEKKTAHRNRAIAHLLKHFGIIEDQDIDQVLDLYFRQCSILVSTKDLAQMAATLTFGGQRPNSGQRVYSKENCRDILSLMFTCGMYDSSGMWAFKVGLPAKSGVSGALFAALPGQLAIAVYSPLIDQHGHSCRGVRVLEDLSREFNLSVFTSGEN